MYSAFSVERFSTTKEAFRIIYPVCTFTVSSYKFAGWHNLVIRRGRSLQVKATSYILVALKLSGIVYTHSYYRQSCARRSHAGRPIDCFYSVIQNGFFAPQGRATRCLDNVKFGMGDSSAPPRQISRYRGRNVEIQPQNWQNLEFWP